jgi:hypothetical protein
MKSFRSWSAVTSRVVLMLLALVFSTLDNRSGAISKYAAISSRFIVKRERNNCLSSRRR